MGMVSPPLIRETDRGLDLKKHCVLHSEDIRHFTPEAGLFLSRAGVLRTSLPSSIGLQVNGFSRLGGSSAMPLKVFEITGTTPTVGGQSNYPLPAGVAGAKAYLHVTVESEDDATVLRETEFPAASRYSAWMLVDTLWIGVHAGSSKVAQRPFKAMFVVRE